MIRVGPAGWSYPDSPGRVYPAATPKKFDVLAFTASYFDTIEINASFYAPQPPRSYASWVRRVAHNPQFRFTAKLWQKFTHGIGEYGRRPAGSWQLAAGRDRKSTRLNSSHIQKSRMPSSA